MPFVPPHFPAFLVPVRLDTRVTARLAKMWMNVLTLPRVMNTLLAPTHPQDLTLVLVINITPVTAKIVTPSTTVQLRTPPLVLVPPKQLVNPLSQELLVLVNLGIPEMEKLAQTLTSVWIPQLVLLTPLAKILKELISVLVSLDLPETERLAQISMSVISLPPVLEMPFVPTPSAVTRVLANLVSPETAKLALTSTNVKCLKLTEPAQPRLIATTNRVLILAFVRVDSPETDLLARISTNVPHQEATKLAPPTQLAPILREVTLVLVNNISLETASTAHLSIIVRTSMKLLDNAMLMHPVILPILALFVNVKLVIPVMERLAQTLMNVLPVILLAMPMPIVATLLEATSAFVKPITRGMESLVRPSITVTSPTLLLEVAHPTPFVLPPSQEFLAFVILDSKETERLVMTLTSALMVLLRVMSMLVVRTPLVALSASVNLMKVGMETERLAQL